MTPDRMAILKCIFSYKKAMTQSRFSVVAGYCLYVARSECTERVRTSGTFPKVLSEVEKQSENNEASVKRRGSKSSSTGTQTANNSW
jgi:hypothetical protein